MAGLLIGLFLLAVDTMALKFWSTTTCAVIDVAFMAWITGGLHLDGLADTGDGLYGRRPVEKALLIMKDSRIGAIGMILAVCCLGLKWAGLNSLAENRSWLLVLIPAYARSGVLFGMRLLPYGRPQGGTGHRFFDTPLTPMDFWGLGVVVILSVFIGWTSLILNIGFLATVGITLWFYKRRMACITGDMLGALIELTETALFLILAAGRYSI